MVTLSPKTTSTVTRDDVGTDQPLLSPRGRGTVLWFSLRPRSTDPTFVQLADKSQWLTPQKHRSLKPQEGS